ncbi:putative sulfate exporter family transporter [Saccharothrix sp. 6-C]|uniref:YeiH family protein n=1 Tax=Saccharothrix sp. 6-C TaxID=2781735 RepID=UPI00191773F0|nr:putative sulfate exporter family transporter [Saccharothrix sp. 6-C]QQQ75307.1 putative sulfate exporter family transporter [Saccharothrix sp. 6-C]
MTSESGAAYRKRPRGRRLGGVLIAALVLGVLVGGRLPELAGVTRWLLRGGVVLLGLQLSVGQLLALGPGVLVAIVVTVSVTFFGTVLLGRRLRLPRGLYVLVASGFSICGASAIAAVEGRVDREDEHVATSVALVTLYGTLAMIALPLLHASPQWIGLSVHEVAQVAAAAPAGGLATAMAVKLGRVALLAPIVAGVGGRGAPPVPGFLLGFLALMLLSPLVPRSVVEVAGTVTTVVLAAALFGLGTSVRLKSLVRSSPRALLLGLFATLLVCGTGYLSLRVV